MKDKKHIKSFNEATENLNISDVIRRLTNLPKYGISSGRERGEYIKWEDLEKVIVDLMKYDV